MRGAGSDTNDELSPDQAFRTIQRASDLTDPGDSVELMNGEYADTSGQGVLRITRSGTLDVPITYRAHHKHSPVLRPVTDWNGISLVGASHIAPGKAIYNQNCLHAGAAATGERWSHLTASTPTSTTARAVE